MTARRKKGTLSKLKPWVMPATAGVTFYSAYLTRATDLFNQGLITKNDVVEAIMYDVTHLDVNAAMTRLQENAFNIGAPLVGGFIVNETKIAGKHSGLIADLLYGLGIGLGAKTVLDPPINQPQKQARQVARPQRPAIQVSSSAPCPTCTSQAPTREYNPYMPGGILNGNRM